MTREELRTQLIQGVDAILNAPLLSRFLTAEQKLILTCQRQLYTTCDAAVDLLLAVVRANGG